MTKLAYAVLWFFVFALPWESTVAIIPGVSVIGKVTGMLALGSALAVAVISGRLRRWHVFHVAALLFIGWLMCLLFFFRTPENLPKIFWTFVQLFMVLWMIWQLAPSSSRLIGLFTAYVMGAHVAASNTILAYLRAQGALRRYAAGGIDANDLAMTLALALPMAWYLGLTHRTPLLRWVCRAYLATGLLAIGLTGSRGGMVASFVALLIVPLTMLRLSPGRRAATIGMLAIAGVVAVVYVPERIVARLATTSEEVQQGRLSGRGTIWRAGFKAFIQKPVVGYGPGGFRRAVRPYLGLSTQVAHNSYLSVLVEEGLIGFLLYATMLGSVWVAVLSLPLLDRRFALVLLTTLAVAMLPLTWEDRKPVWFIMAALVGLSQAPLGGRAGSERPDRSPQPVPVPSSSRATRTAPRVAPYRNARRGAV